MIRKVKRPSGLDQLEDDQWANVVEEIEMAIEDTSMILWVGSADGHYAMFWEDFKTLFADTDYRLTGGMNVLASDLVVKLNDGTWYEQDPTNGCWYHRHAPAFQSGAKSFSHVTNGQDGPWGGCSLEELNEDND